MVSTDFLVSDQITDAMFGMDWLRRHRCRISFGTGALFVGKRRFTFVKGDGAMWCRRMTVAEEVTLPPRAQCHVPCQMQYRDLRSTADAWMIENREVRPGVHVARMVLGDRDQTASLRVINLGKKPTLAVNQSIGNLHPVEIEVASEVASSDNEHGDANMIELVAGIDSEVGIDIRERLTNLLDQYRTVFSATDRDLGRTGIGEHRIDTGRAHPVRQPLRRQPAPYHQVIDERVDEMLATGVVEPAVSEWAPNVVLAKKKDGSLRFCTDYRKLNAVTKKDAYPLPQEDALAGAGWFFTLDLRSGYHQVPMYLTDADKTAFITRCGTFKWRVMPFGLCNAPATFQRTMDLVLSGLNFEVCLVCLDDVIIFSRDPVQHLNRLEQVLKRLQGANLKLKPSKCHLLRRSVSFLGHVSEAGISVEADKTQQVADRPVPEHLRHLRSFVGVCSYYRKFIRRFSTIAAPLFCLTREGQKSARKRSNNSKWL